MINLCQDQYGNYVIQNLLQKRQGEKCKDIYDALRGRILDMSMQMENLQSDDDESK